ncbi:MAG TPA: hypothetical protein V6C71_02840 [Coleofasciculaceae cyanobacterium]
MHGLVMHGHRPKVSLNGRHVVSALAYRYAYTMHGNHARANGSWDASPDANPLGLIEVYLKI